MVKIPLSYIFIFVNKLHFLTMYFIYVNSVFHIYDLHSCFIIFKSVLSSSSFLFFPSCPSFSFHPFSSFHICPFFPYVPLFSFPNLYHFLNLVCHFLRAPLPCSCTFCWPGQNYQISQKNLLTTYRDTAPLTKTISMSCVLSQNDQHFFSSNVSILVQIVRGTQKWHWNFSRPSSFKVMGQNSQNIVWSITQEPLGLLRFYVILSFLDNMCL